MEKRLHAEEIIEKDSQDELNNIVNNFILEVSK